MIKHSKQNQAKRGGFTLVELLVVIIIATVVLSIAIPRIRVINKERNLRESARVAGSAFANASQRALIDGRAGVRITRNPNFLDAGGLEFAATEVSILRRVPSYSGDQFNDRITGLAGNVVSIRMPLEQDSLSIVQEGDSISFGGSSVQYRISAVNENATLDLTLERGRRVNYMPMPAFDGSDPTRNPRYVIHRRPRVLRSSRVDLPSGNIIDLRFSGFESEGGGQASFEASTLVDVVFRDDGSIDQVFATDAAGVVTSQIPLGPLYLMVTEAPISDPAPSPLDDPQSLWVAIANNGGTNIGYNNTNNGGDVVDARDSSLTTSATQ